MKELNGHFPKEDKLMNKRYLKRYNRKTLIKIQ